MMPGVHTRPGFSRGDPQFERAGEDQGAFVVVELHAIRDDRLAATSRAVSRVRYRNGANMARISSEKICGSSQAAKWPPRAALLK
jgi:hypothetical protein